MVQNLQEHIVRKEFLTRDHGTTEVPQDVKWKCTKRNAKFHEIVPKNTSLFGEEKQISLVSTGPAQTSSVWCDENAIKKERDFFTHYKNSTKSLKKNYARF